MGSKRTSELKTNESHIVGKINDTIACIFYGDKLKDIAKQTDFVQRSSSRLKGNEFLQAMLLASIDPESTPLSGINDNLRMISSKAKMTVSALRQRVNTSEAQAFLKETYQYVLETKLKPLSAEFNACNPLNEGSLKYFPKVIIHDSSRCALNELLEKDFKGAGGSATKSEAKIDSIYDIKTNSMEEIILTDVREPDQSLSARVLKHITKDSLIIQDLGYFDTTVFESIESREGYYLSRLQGGVQVYLNEDDKKPIELGKFLQSRSKRGLALDVEVFITKKKDKNSSYSLSCARRGL